MPDRLPEELSVPELRARLQRVRRIAHRVGFAGRIVYEHAYSSTGGATFALGRRETDDLLIVYAEAFDRDAAPDEFSLEAIIAHERGHQMLFRNPDFARRITEGIPVAIEEALASLIGSKLCRRNPDRVLLEAKATAEFLLRGITMQTTIDLVERMKKLVEEVI